MFDSLSEKLQSSLDDLRSRGKLSEADLDRAMRGAMPVSRSVPLSRRTRDRSWRQGK